NRQLCGHEDVEPLRRSNTGGGWDPGAHRTNPTFSWTQLWSRIQAVGGTPAPPVVPSRPAPAPVPAPSGGAGPRGVFGSIAGVAQAAAAFAGGLRDPNRLTDIIFYARHPERGGRRIAAGETALAQEWRWIRDNIVSTVLRTTATVTTSGPATAGYGRTTPAAQRWAGLVRMLDRYRGDIPLDF